ncbi:hypothetical protein BTTAP_90076 [Brochothrix thermosphacta]|nr:hypothetical protein BTTAP_90076 [Brochothrix thermosphacta]
MSTEEKVYDVIIIGAGPAGMAAALYASRSELSTLMIEVVCQAVKWLTLQKLKTILVLVILLGQIYQQK